MTGYIESVNVMHTRGVSINEQDYLFTLLVVLGEEPQTAYAICYDIDGLRKHIGTEDEDAYIRSKQKDAENILAQQNIIQLHDLLSESYRSQVQTAALNLTDYHFSGQETVQILNNLLKTRVNDLESSSVRDVVGIIKMLTEQGALDTGDGGFSKHFIVVKDPFTALCTNCNREFDCYAGLGAVCPHCGAQYHWSEEENRFIPQPSKL